MKIEKGQVWISKENPHRSIEITYVTDLFDFTDEGMVSSWCIYDMNAFDKFVVDKKFNGVGKLEDYLKQGKNTSPYPSWGECSIKSMKQRIRKEKLELLEQDDKNIVLK